MNNTSFFNYSSNEGAIYIFNGDIYEGKLAIKLFNNTFEDCSSPSGGAIKIVNMKNTIITSSNFKSNKAETFGGAIFFSCIMSFQCSLTIVDSIF